MPIKYSNDFHEPACENYLILVYFKKIRKKLQTRQLKFVFIMKMLVKVPSSLIFNQVTFHNLILCCLELFIN